MFIVRKKSSLESVDKKPAKPLTTILHGYGGHGKVLSPVFNPMALLLMNNLGGVYAIANIRGGGEYGTMWHNAATKAKKETSFDDFIAAAEFLTQTGITDAKHLTIHGGSSGGIVVTTCANRRPELFASVLANVPVTDMLRFN